MAFVRVEIPKRTKAVKDSGAKLDYRRLLQQT